MKFRRQFGIGRYVVDFYCPDQKLAIELDGESHFLKQAEKQDLIRQLWIENQGIHFLRFTNLEIYENLEGVLQKILEVLEEKSPVRYQPHPNPLLEKEREPEEQELHLNEEGNQEVTATLEKEEPSEAERISTAQF
jgi:LPS sulfotransferase NodH